MITAFTFIELNRNKVNNEVDSCLLGIKMPETENMTVKITCVTEHYFEGVIIDCKLDYFKDKKLIRVKCYDFTNIIEKDGSKFNYSREYPNLDQSTFTQGDVLIISFQSYEYADGLRYVNVNASSIKIN